MESIKVMRIDRRFFHALGASTLARTICAGGLYGALAYSDVFHGICSRRIRGKQADYLLGIQSAEHWHACLAVGARSETARGKTRLLLILIGRGPRG